MIDQMSKDLRSEFPDMKGFSPQNLKYMRRFAQEYNTDVIGQQAVDQLPWGHIVTLMYAISDRTERAFYIQGTLENGFTLGVSLSNLMLEINTRCTYSTYLATLIIRHSNE